MIATIDSATPGKIFAEVIGDPITQSKSPLIHRFWLNRLGIDADYRACHVLPGQLASYLAQRSADPAWRGCNVTVPYKLAVLDHVADPGGVRSSIGAANTLARDAARQIFATNTDAAGFYAPIADLDLVDQPVAVIGAGGAARAVLFALARAGVGPVAIFNRNVLKASAVLASFGLKGRALPLGAPLPPVKLLVNASVLGMVGQDPLDVSLDALPDDACVYDLVYSPLVTPLLAQADDRGLITIDGLDMLVGQAGMAFELFFGAPAPRDDASDAELRALLTT